MSVSSRIFPPSSDAPVLTMGDIERWKERQALIKERDETEKRRAIIDLKIAALDKELAPVEPLIQALTEDLHIKKHSAEPEHRSVQAMLPEFEKQDRRRTELTENAFKLMTEVALELGRERGAEGFESREVRHVVVNDESLDPSVRNINRDYVYTVMKRLIDKAILAKSGTKYVLPEYALNAGGPVPLGGKAIAGFKMVPVTKAEQVRDETASYLSHRPNKTAHRTAIADHLCKLSIMGTEKNTLSQLTVYLTRWPEFKTDGSGNYTYLPLEKDSATEGDSVA